MITRKLGTNGPQVGVIGLGCMGMSEFYGPADDAESVRVIHRALELGIDFFDTSDAYGPYINEELVGRALADRRDRAVIATKFSFVRNKKGDWKGVSGKPEYVRTACEASLKRLGVDTIDLYYQHRVDRDTPIEDTVGAMADLIREGKVRHIGLSEAAPDTIRRACAVHPIAALQTEYSLWSRDPEDELLDVCRELGVAFVAYSPLGRGFLSGRLRTLEGLADDDYRRRSPRFMDENLQKNLALVDKIEEIAAAKGCSAAQLALAWVIAKDPNTLTIPGTTKIDRLEQNAAAAEVVLDNADLAAIDAVAPRGVAAGDRYSKLGMKMVDG
jgi:aryl-alcohol dehydrogenase-like predicted oxidoreductase